MSDVTALIPIHRDKGNREWLQQAVNSLGPDVDVLVLENDGEVTDALNHGLKEATSDFVLPFGADDVADKGMVQRLRAAIVDVDVAYPGMLLVDESLKQLLGTHAAQQFCPRRLLQQNYITGSSLIRREKALEAGGYRDLESWEDWDLWVRMARIGAKFKPVVDAAFFYRQVHGSRNRSIETDWEDLRRRVVGDGEPNEDVLATFYSGSTPVTAYVRCILPSRYLPGITRFDGGYEEVEGPEGVSWEFPLHRGAAVMQFAAGRSGALALGYLRDLGHRVLVETDDNYLVEGDRDFRKRAQWAKLIGQGEYTTEGHRWIVKEADGVIVSTEFIAKQYRKVNPNVFVCGNQIDPVDWPDLDKPDDGVLRIGWFASPSHAGDGKLIKRAAEWAAGQKDVELVAMGYDPGWRFPHRRLPWTNDQSVYRRAMQVLDIGLAPVVPTPFSRGRSDLKWLEYSMAGAASLVSDCEPYQTVPDELAVKCASAADFYKAVKRLVANRDEVKQLAAAAREHVLAERTMERNAWRWQEAVEG